MSVALAVITALLALLTTGAVAAAHSKRKSPYWLVGLNDVGQDHHVDDGGTFTFCGSESVGGLSVVVPLSPPIEKGETFGFGMDGPKAAGDATPTDEGISSATVTVVKTGESPVLFPKLARKNESGFPVGTYKFYVTGAGRVVASEKVTLKYRAAC